MQDTTNTATPAVGGLTFLGTLPEGWVNIGRIGQVMSVREHTVADGEDIADVRTKLAGEAYADCQAQHDATLGIAAGTITKGDDTQLVLDVSFMEKHDDSGGDTVACEVKGVVIATRRQDGAVADAKQTTLGDEGAYGNYL